MRRIFWSLTASAALLTAACATIMQGTTQEVGVSSTPTDAEVIVDNQERGSTPLALDLERESQHTVRIEMDGYEPYEVTLTKSTSGWVWGNIVFGGLIGLAVDAITGGLYKLNPAQVEAELARAEDEAARLQVDEEGVYLFVTMQPKVEWERLEAAGLERRW